MSKTKISDYSSTPADNTDIGGINIAEGMLASDVNNAIREQMAQLKNFQSGTSGESVTFATVNATTISASNINKVTVTAPATGSTLTIADGKTLTANNSLTLAGTDAKTLTVNNSLTLAGTDATTMTFPSTSATIARTDAAQTFTGAQTFSDTVTATKLIPTGNVTAGNGMYLPAANTVAFSTNGSERMRIDSSGNVGIGTSSPSGRLHVSSTDIDLYLTGTRGTDNTYSIRSSGANAQYLDISDVTAGNRLSLHGSDLHAWYIAGTERARITSGGDLLVGKTNTTFSTVGFAYENGNALELTRDGGATLRLNRLTSNGETVQFYRSSTQVGGIGVTTDGPGFGTTSRQVAVHSNFFPAQSYGSALDNTMSCGQSGARWSAVWAANGTIQTSDEREKKDIEESALGADFIKSLRPVSYKWVVGGNDLNVEEDGTESVEVTPAVLDEDGNEIEPAVFEERVKYKNVLTPKPGTRTHWGFIAQEVKAAVDAAGVDFGGWVLTDKDDPESQQALRYDQFIAPMVKALQEAMERIETLEAKVAALEQA
jgi:hypothetical protein